MVFHWSLSDSKSQVSRTRLRILAVLSNAVVWIVSTRPPTSKSSRLFNNPLVIVPNAPITIGTIATFMFHSFFNSLARSSYLSYFSLSFRFNLWSAGTAKSTILQILFVFCFFCFLLIVMRSGLPAGIRWSVCILKSRRSLCGSFCFLHQCLLLLLLLLLLFIYLFIYSFVYCWLINSFIWFFISFGFFFSESFFFRCLYKNLGYSNEDMKQIPDEIKKNYRIKWI